MSRQALMILIVILIVIIGYLLYRGGYFGRNVMQVVPSSTSTTPVQMSTPTISQVATPSSALSPTLSQAPSTTTPTRTGY